MTGREKIADYLVGLLKERISSPVYPSWSNLDSDVVDPEGVIIVEAGNLEDLHHNGVHDVKLTMTISGQTLQDADPAGEKLSALEKIVTEELWVLDLLDMSSVTALDVVGITQTGNGKEENEQSRIFSIVFDLFITDYE